MAQPTERRRTVPRSATGPAELWIPTTIRVAWELALARIKIRPAVLVDIREHVLRSLPPDARGNDCDPLVALYTREYLERVRADRYVLPALDPWHTEALPAAWKSGVESVLDHVAESVYRLHYGDGVSMGQVERVLRLDRSTLEAARGGIRALIGELAVTHPAGRPLEGDEACDLVLARLATTTAWRCPGPMGLASDEGRDHAAHCSRCARALRLIRQGALSPNDLFVPDGPLLLASEVGVVALVLHPDAHKFKKLVARALGELAVPVGTDAWLFDARDQEAIEGALRALCEAGTPPRYHIRGGRTVGEGRWRRGVVLGPVAHAALAAARSSLWSEVEGFHTLPAPTPPPPRAHGLWAVAAGVFIAAVSVGLALQRVTPPQPLFPLEATFSEEGDALVARFDADDLATLDIVLERAGVDGPGPEVVIAERALQSGKGALATGEGDYRLVSHARRMALISSGEAIDDLDLLVAAASSDPDPLGSLQARLAARHPRTHVVLSPVLPMAGTPTEGAAVEDR